MILNNKTMTTKIIAKSIIIFFLIACLFKMPYGYYQIMRIAVTALFCYLAYEVWEESKTLSFLCGIGIIIFQPLQKLAFHKKDWQIIDVLISSLLVIWIIFDLIKTARKSP